MKIPNKIKFSRQNIFILIFALLGLMLFISTLAQSIQFSFEAEDATLNEKISTVSSANSSGGQYIEFGSGDNITGTAYYVDCAGSDSASGTSTGEAWRTLSKASSASLQPGDGILLRRDCTWSGSLAIEDSGTSDEPIIISGYGSGDLPVITNNTHNTRSVDISGSYIVVSGLDTRATPPNTVAECDNVASGYIIGFLISPPAHHVTIKNSRASGNYAGVYIEYGSHDNTVVNNQLLDNNMMNPVDTSNPDNDAGAFGVLIHGDDNIIADNTINDSYACSFDYVADGAAVEIYRGSGNMITRNKSADNDAFSEIGMPEAVSNTFAYNSVVSNRETSTFVVLRGPESGFGPNLDTKILNNSVYFTGAQSQGVVCHAGCSSSVMTLKNNILVAGWKSIYADNAFDGGNNIFWREGGDPFVQAPVAGSSQSVNPLFVDPGNSDLRLQNNSPAIDSASSATLDIGVSVDADGNSVPVGTGPDIGAFEFLQ